MSAPSACVSSLHVPTPLAPIVSRVLSSVLGADLSNVRVCWQSRAAHTFGAQAFAIGNTVHVAPGAIDLRRTRGWQILAHELAHVVQQRDGRVAGARGTVPFHDEQLEEEARAAEDAVAQLFARGHGPSRPLFVRRARGDAPRTLAVQCLMSEAEFKTATKAAGLRNKIASVDTALKAYHTANAARPRNYPALLTALRAVYAACQTYQRDRPDSARGGGVDTLMRQIATEEVLLSALAGFATEADNLKKFERLEEAQELVLQLRGRGNFVRQHADQEVIDLITAHNNTLRQAGQSAGAVDHDIEQLTALADRATLPRVLRNVILECTKAQNLRQLDKRINKPGAIYNVANGATQKYVLNHATEQYLGRKFRLGSLLHELTHISIAETFDNTVIMLAISPTATDEQMLARARDRNTKISSLQSQLAASALPLQLKNACIDKAGYATSLKIDSYISAFKKQLGDATVTRLRGLVARGMRSELIEYDTVVNQMALWCHLWDIPVNEPAYATLLSLVEAASYERAQFRHFPTGRVGNALPVRPARRMSV